MLRKENGHSVDDNKKMVMETGTAMETERKRERWCRLGGEQKW
ncbi:MAG: hypothetical protein CM15mV24_2020 [Bellamyvirus sp.]|nr:MAG: hypothetical protein CM15mV24_2020 [Bellamyvirus sp.]